MTPTGRTLSALRSAGFVAEVVERWLPHVNRRADLFGIGDVIAIRAGERPQLVQVTSNTNVAARVMKAKREPRLRVWLQSGCTFAVHGWGNVDGRWTCRIVPLVLDDVDNLAAVMPARRKRRRAERGLFDGMELAGSVPDSVPRCESGSISAGKHGVFAILPRLSTALDSPAGTATTTPAPEAEAPLVAAGKRQKRRKQEFVSGRSAYGSPNFAPFSESGVSA
jgi:hypothetical protein